jgi:hypothetical protein
MHILNERKHGNTIMFTQTINCNRCSGTGNVGFYWVMGGVCFKCDGVGSYTKTTKTDPEVLRVRREKAAAKAAAARVAKAEIASAAYAEKEATRKAAYDAVVAKSKEEERPVPVTDERCNIVGEIVSLKWKDSDYGAVLKMLVKSDLGFKVWGSVPRSILVDDETALKGKRVKFTARIQPSKDDACFGFISRPTKADVLSA